MFIHRDRERLVEAMVYFAEHTKHCGKTKLIKLLYLLDFEHIRQTGVPVTHLDYYAWQLGPVPIDVYEEWDNLRPDLAEAIEIVPERVVSYVRERMHAKRPFNPAQFTKRQIRIMETLAQRFSSDYSKPTVNITHDERGPWAKIWDSGRGKNERIPFILAIPDQDPNRDALLSYADEQQGMRVAHATAA